MSLLDPQIRSFFEVARVGTVLGAAENLGVTPTAVTQRLRGLEQRLGGALFTRSRRGMTPTPEGEALLRYCLAAQDLEGEALSKIGGAAVRAEVRVKITGPTSIMSTRIVRSVMKAARAYPELLLAFDVNDIEDRLSDLRSGVAQLAIVPPEQVSRELDSKLLRPERYLLVGTSKWKGRKLREIIASERIIDFDETDRMTHRYLTEFGIQRDARSGRQFVNDNSALIALFVQGYGYGVLTEEVASPWLKRGALISLNAGRSYSNRLALAWYPRNPMPAYLRAIVSSIQ